MLSDIYVSAIHYRYFELKPLQLKLKSDIIYTSQNKSKDILERYFVLLKYN